MSSPLVLTVPQLLARHRREVVLLVVRDLTLVINLKTAMALGVTIPPSLLQRADEVIQ